MSKYFGKILMALAVSTLLILSPGCKKDNFYLNYNHNLHVVENEIECSTCHTETAGAMSRPDHSVCSECHEIDEDNPSADCLLCHKVKSPDQIEVRYPEQPETKEIVFSHEKHDYMNVGCQDCHTQAAESTSAKEDILPQMKACLTCHDDQTAPRKQCSVCHVESSPVNATHKPDWEYRHGLESKAANSNCLVCHSEDTCIECHQDKKPKDHNNTWRRITHGGEAAWNRSRCMVCHQEDFCDRCHRSTLPRSHKTGAWNSGVAPVHCSQCHFPSGSVGCGVCHESAPHSSAIPSPHPPYSGFTCEACHPTPVGVYPPHQDPGIACTTCHERS